MDREAFEKARAAYGTGAYDDATLEFLFPQLKESEEERIVKDLIGGLMWQRDNLGRLGPHDDNLILPGFCENVGKHLSWLEKQKEQDKCPEYCVRSHCMGCSIYEKQKEQKSAKKQDYSGLNDLERAIHRGFLAAGVENVPVTIIKETAKECLAAATDIEAKGLLLNGFITFEEYLEIADVPYAGKILQERKARQAKNAGIPKWSEEDEKTIKEIHGFLYEASCGIYRSYEKERFNRWESWLKSLRPRWKPSEEQMGAFCRCVDYLEESDNEDADIMAELYEQLKKL